MCVSALIELTDQQESISVLTKRTNALMHVGPLISQKLVHTHVVGESTNELVRLVYQRKVIVGALVRWLTNFVQRLRN